MTRTLLFQIDNTIDREIMIMLTFAKPSDDRDVKQVVYRVLKFGRFRKTDSVRYNFDDFVFSAVTIERRGDITEQARVAIAPGQKTSIIQGPDSPLDVTFMHPSPDGRPNFFQCTNETEAAQDIAIGFPDTPLLVWPKIFRGVSVFAASNPILTAYEAVEYEEGQLITGDIDDEYRVLLQQDLTGLPETQSFIISRNPVGILTIQPANAA